MDDKKKLAIVGVLAAIVVGIGAFSFLGGGSKSPAKAAVAPPSKKDAVAAPETKGVPNPEFAAKLPERDPFKSSGDVAPVTPAPTQPKQQSAPPPPHMRGNFASAADVLPNANAPLTVALPAPVFSYRLAGLILGRHPAAVFMDTADKSASQRLIPIGGSIDGDTQLISVNKGLAVVSFRGKKLRLTLGGTPDAN